MKTKIAVLVATFIVFCVGIWFYEKEQEEKAEFSIGQGSSEVDKATGGIAGFDNQVDQKDSDGSVFAYICGEVSSPGVYEVDTGGRINDLLEKAGGFTEAAATDYVNLASPVTDGMMVYIPSMEEAENMPETNGSGHSSNNGNGFNGSESGLININCADVGELTKLPGIGETKAEAIITYRNQNGGYKSVEEIKNVSGIGDSTYDKIKSLITVND